MVIKMNTNNVQPIFTLLPDTIYKEIVPKLTLSDCVAMARACKQWSIVFSGIPGDRIYDRVIFDEKMWKQIPGIESVSTYEVDPDKKEELLKRLQDPCDIFNVPDPIEPHRFQERTDNRFWETRLVILFPKEINGKPVTINLIGELHRFGGAKISEEAFPFNIFNDSEDREHRKKAAEGTYFAEVCLDAFPGTRDTSHQQKMDLLEPTTYRIPSLLEGAIGNLVIKFCQKGNYLPYFAEDRPNNRMWYVSSSGEGDGPKARVSKLICFEGVAPIKDVDL